MKHILFLALAILFISPQSYAQQNGNLPDVPDAIQSLVERGAQIRYLGKRHGMDGWITIFQGQEQYYYVTPDGQGFVMGVLFDGDGTMATIDQVRDLQKSGEGDVLNFLTADRPPETQSTTQSVVDAAEGFEARTPAQRMFADIENANWVSLGANDAPVIYSFIDPQCPHCHDFVKDLRADYLDKGRVQVRLIPVGFREDTLAQAAFLLAAPDAQERFFNHLDGDEAALPVQNEISTQGVQRNLALMQAWKFNVTPLTVYESRDGEIKIIRGRAQNLPGLLADLPG